jgi:hypothetical protein
LAVPLLIAAAAVGTRGGGAAVPGHHRASIPRHSVFRAGGGRGTFRELFPQGLVKARRNLGDVQRHGLFVFGASEGCCPSGGALSKLLLLWLLPLELLKARRNLGATVRSQDHHGSFFGASPLDGRCLRERRAPGGALSEPALLLWLLALELLLRARRVPGAVRRGFFLEAVERCCFCCGVRSRALGEDLLRSDPSLEKIFAALVGADGSRRRPFDLPSAERRRRAPDRQEGGVVVVVVIVVAAAASRVAKVVVPVDGRRRRGERRCRGGCGGPVLEGRRSAGSEKGMMAAAAVRRGDEAPELPDRVPDGGAGAVLEELPPAVHELKEKQDGRDGAGRALVRTEKRKQKSGSQGALLLRDRYLVLLASDGGVHLLEAVLRLFFHLPFLPFSFLLRDKAHKCAGLLCLALCSPRTNETRKQEGKVLLCGARKIAAAPHARSAEGRRSAAHGEGRSGRRDGRRRFF